MVNKWRISVPRLKRNNQRAKMAVDWYQTKVKKQSFAMLTEYLGNKMQLRMIKSNCDRISQEKLMVKSFGILKEYIRHRRVANRNKTIVS